MGKSHFGIPKLIFFTVPSVPPALLQAEGVPREQTGPSGEQEVSVHCRTGEVLHTRVSEATNAKDVSLGLSSPCWQQDPPPSQADFPCSCDKSHLMSSGQTHPNKGYGIKSWILSLSCESISSSQLCALFGGWQRCPPLFLPQALPAAAVK